MKTSSYQNFMFGRHLMSVALLFLLFVYVSSQEGVVAVARASVSDSSSVVSSTTTTANTNTGNNDNNNDDRSMQQRRRGGTRKLRDNNGEDNGGGLGALLDTIFGGGGGDGDGDNGKDDKNSSWILDDDLFNITDGWLDGNGTGSDGFGDIIDGLFNFTDDQWNATYGDDEGDDYDPFDGLLDFIDKIFGGGNGTLSFNSSNGGDGSKDDITDAIDELLQNITNGRYNSTSNLTDIFEEGLFNFDSLFDLIGSLFGNGTFWFDTNGTSIDDITDAINDVLQNITDGNFNGTDFNITDILDDLFNGDSNGTILELISEIFDSVLGNGTWNGTDSWSDIIDNIFGDVGNSSDFDFDDILSGINVSDVDLDDIQDAVDGLLDTLKDWFGDDLNITSINVTDIVMGLFNTTNVTEIFKNVTKELNNTATTRPDKSQEDNNSTTTTTTKTNTSTSAVTANSNTTGGSSSSASSYDHLRFVSTVMGMTMVASIGILVGFV